MNCLCHLHSKTVTTPLLYSLLIAPFPAWNSAYTYADGTWDFNGFSRYMHHRKWITKVTNDDDRLVKEKRPGQMLSRPLVG